MRITLFLMTACALIGGSGCIMTEDTIARANGTYSTGKPQETPPKAQPLYYGLVPFAFVGDMCIGSTRLFH